MKWFNKHKDEVWFQVAIGLGAVVILYFLLQNLTSIWTGVKVIWNVIVPLIVGVIIAYIIDPLVRLFEQNVFKKMKRRKMARNISVAIGCVLVLALLAIILWLLIPQIFTSIEMLINNLGTYMTNFETWLESIGGGIFKKTLSGVNFSDITGTIVNWLTAILSVEGIVNTSVSLGSGVVSFVMSAILAVYYLCDKERLIGKVKSFCKFVLKDKKYDSFIAVCSNCNKILVRYICCSLLEAVAVGICNAIVMLAFGMPYVVIISVIFGLFNLAPTFGPIASCIIGAFILLMVNPLYALIFIISTLIIQGMDGYVLKPRLFSGTLGVSSILILMSIIVFGRIFGVVGIIFSIPIAAIIQYIYREAQDKRSSKNQAEAANSNIAANANSDTSGGNDDNG